MIIMTKRRWPGDEAEEQLNITKKVEGLSDQNPRDSLNFKGEFRFSSQIT